jgi:ABC-type amino acid transport substrate-binding protein
VNDFDDELLQMMAAELLDALRAHPEWVTRDEHLREAATRLEAERLLTPEVIPGLLVPIFPTRLPPEEMSRLIPLLDSGHVDQVVSALRSVIARHGVERLEEDH